MTKSDRLVCGAVVVLVLVVVECLIRLGGG